MFMVSVDGYYEPLHESQPLFPMVMKDANGDYAGHLFKGPTPKMGGNGQLELLMRSLQQQKAADEAAKLVLEQTTITV